MGRRKAWFLCGSALVLSLSAFSYLIPETRTAAGGQTKSSIPSVKQVWLPPVESGSLLKRHPSAPPLEKTRSQAEKGQWTDPSVPELGDWSVNPDVSARTELRGTPKIAHRSGLLLQIAPSELDLSFDRKSETLDRPGLHSIAALSEGELLALEEEYEIAFSSLFGFEKATFGWLSALGNPFEGALEKQGSEKQGPETVAKKAENGPSTPLPERSEEVGSSSAIARRPDTETTPSNPFDFLVVGDCGSNEGENVLRATRDRRGDFVVENSFRFNFLAGLVGVMFVFQENEQPLTVDLNGDGLTDLVYARHGDEGTTLESYVRDPSGSFHRWAFSTLPQSTVTSFAVFDFNADGQLEIAALLKNHPRLIIYERSGDQFEYLREVVLPLSPGWVVDSEQGVPPERRLHIFDTSLQRVVTLRQQNGRFLLSGSKEPLSYLQGVEVEASWQEIGSHEIVVFEYGNRIALAERRSQGVSFYGSFDTAVKVPLVIVGDYLGIQSRQLVYVP